MTSSHDQDAETPSGGAPQFSRALLALVAAATIAVAPIADRAIAPAGNGDGAHASPVYLLALASHDIGHNDWAFQGGLAGPVAWAVAYAAIAVFWLGVALWMRFRARAAGRSGGRLWLRALVAAWATEVVTAALTVGGGLYAHWTSTAFGPVALRLADLCSPWWACVAATAVVAFAERSLTTLRAIASYGVLLAVLLLVALPGPDVVKVLVLAAAAAAGALLGGPGPGPEPAPVRLDAAAAG